MIGTVIVLFTLTGASLAQTTPQWSHYDEGAWPGKCNVGKEQSPIDIVPMDTLADLHGSHIRGELVFRGYSDVLVTARNTGYKVRWAVVPGTPAPVLSGGPLRGNYTFAEVHLHWLSEHSINGIKFPLEIHMVHLKTGLTYNEALKQRDGVAVIGVLAQVGSHGNSRVLEELLPSIDDILEKSSQDTASFNIDLTRLFSPEMQAYYTYHGSLTTPLCPEVVTWIVMEKPTIVTHEHYKNLTRADLNGINNDRSVKPLGQRLVFRSRAAIAAPTPVLAALAAVLAAAGSKVSTLLGGLSSLVDIKKRLFDKLVKQSSN